MEVSLLTEWRDLLDTKEIPLSFQNEKAIALVMPNALILSSELESAVNDPNQFTSAKILASFLRENAVARRLYSFIRAFRIAFSGDSDFSEDSGEDERRLRAEPVYTRRKMQRFCSEEEDVLMQEEEVGDWGVFQSLDPDCNIRECRHISGEDLYSQKKLTKCYWENFKRGRKEPFSDQYWRRLSIGEWGSFDDKSLISRFENIILWKRTCKNLATIVKSYLRFFFHFQRI